jgi:hypothetical protein
MTRSIRRPQSDICHLVALAALVLLPVVPASAQDPPPPIPIVVVDVHGNIPRFPNDPLLADSRGLTQPELPGMGRGAQIGMHLRVVKLKAVTFGIGGQAIFSQAKQTPAQELLAQIKAVTEQFRSINAQLSLNFGNGNGWSYVSGGIGRAKWSIVPEGLPPLAGDEEVLSLFNYGGGARWFAKSHLAFSFDLRFHAINPGAVISLPGHQASPRSRFMVIGAGISVK